MGYRLCKLYCGVICTQKTASYSAVCNRAGAGLHLHVVLLWTGVRQEITLGVAASGPITVLHS